MKNEEQNHNMIPLVPLLGVYLKKTKTLYNTFPNETRTPHAHAALLTVIKIRKQPKCPPEDERVKRTRCVDTHTDTHDGVLHSHEEEWNLAVRDGTDWP